MLGGQGRNREALTATRTALPMAQAEDLVADHWARGVMLATVLNNLGWFHARLGELDQARPYCEQALQRYRDAGSRYGEAITQDSLAYIHAQAGDHARAIACYRLAARQLRQLGALSEAAGMQHPGADEALAKLRQLDATSHRDPGDREISGAGFGLVGGSPTGRLSRGGFEQGKGARGDHDREDDDAR